MHLNFIVDNRFTKRNQRFLCVCILHNDQRKIASIRDKVRILKTKTTSASGWVLMSSRAAPTPCYDSVFVLMATFIALRLWCFHPLFCSKCADVTHSVALIRTIDSNMIIANRFWTMVRYQSRELFDIDMVKQLKD